MYCAVHNADCPYHGQPDQMVLSLKPHAVPEPWACPAAVNEMAQFEREAERYMDQGSSDFAF